MRRLTALNERGTESRARYTMKGVSDEALWLQEKITAMMQKLADAVTSLEREEEDLIAAESRKAFDAADTLADALQALSKKAS